MNSSTTTDIHEIRIEETIEYTFYINAYQVKKK